MARPDIDTEVAIAVGPTSETIYDVNRTQGSYVPWLRLAPYCLSIVGPVSHQGSLGAIRPITAMSKTVTRTFEADP
jgi:hypothetical protein